MIKGKTLDEALKVSNQDIADYLDGRPPEDALFANAHLLLGPGFAFLETTIVPGYKGYLLMILPPGGFLVVSLLLARNRVLDQRCAVRTAMAAPEAAAS